MAQSWEGVQNMKDITNSEKDKTKKHSWRQILDESVVGDAGRLAVSDFESRSAGYSCRAVTGGGQGAGGIRSLWFALQEGSVKTNKITILVFV